MNPLRRAVLLVFFLAIAVSPAVAQPATDAKASADSSIELSVTGGTLHGTLLLPEAAGTVPVALLIAGSGPTDRDGNSAMIPGKNNALRLLAEGLAKSGIASVRYDKRGIAESSKAMTAESDLRFETYVDDAAAWCTHLRGDKRFSRVVVVGHSEGSLIGMLAAKQCQAAGYVSLEGVGRPAPDILRLQLASKLPPDLAAGNEQILRSLEQGKTVEKVPSPLLALYRPSVQPYLISWFKYDPAKAIGELRVPVLIVGGTTDIQVGVEDAKKLAAGNPRAKLLVIEGMNHVLKAVSADGAKQMASYGDPSLALAPELMPAIVDLVARSGK